MIQAGEFVAFDDAVALAVALHAAGYPLAAASSSKNANELMRRIDVAIAADRLRDSTPRRSAAGARCSICSS